MVSSRYDRLDGRFLVGSSRRIPSIHESYPVWSSWYQSPAQMLFPAFTSVASAMLAATISFASWISDMCAPQLTCLEIDSTMDVPSQ